MEPASREKMADLIRRCIRSGHTSVLEHVSFTFAISGVARVLSHQLVRHRMASREGARMSSGRVMGVDF